MRILFGIVPMIYFVFVSNSMMFLRGLEQDRVVILFRLVARVKLPADPEPIDTRKLADIVNDSSNRHPESHAVQEYSALVLHEVRQIKEMPHEFSTKREMAI